MHGTLSQSVGYDCGIIATDELTCSVGGLINDIMPKLTLQVRTHDNLLELLAKGQTHAWIVAEEKVQRITHVQVVNFEGTQMIEGVFDQNSSYYTTEYTSESRLVVKFLNGHIVNCNVQFKSQNPVHYIEE